MDLEYSHNTTTVISVENKTDKFGVVFHRPDFQALAWLLWITIQTVGNFLLSAIIFGIVSLHNKTLLHLMYLRICFASVVYNVVPLNINILRFLWGPLPRAMCAFNNLSKVRKTC